MTGRPRTGRRRHYGPRRHDVATRPRDPFYGHPSAAEAADHDAYLDPLEPATDYRGVPIAPETALEQRARDGDR